MLQKKFYMSARVYDKSHAWPNYLKLKLCQLKLQKFKAAQTGCVHNEIK